MQSFELRLQLAKEGDAEALAELFHEHEPKLLRMLAVRLDRRLQGRLDILDVLQEAYIEFSRSIGRYQPDPQLSFYIWIRMLTIRKLATMQRGYLGTAARDVHREFTQNPVHGPAALSGSLADLFVGQLTSPSRAALRNELRTQVHEALDELAPIDRDVIAMRHFEQLSNQEVAAVLELTEPAASTRYIRAARRLKPLLQRIMALEHDGE